MTRLSRSLGQTDMRKQKRIKFGYKKSMRNENRLSSIVLLWIIQHGARKHGPMSYLCRNSVLSIVSRYNFSKIACVAISYLYPFPCPCILVYKSSLTINVILFIPYYLSILLCMYIKKQMSNFYNECTYFYNSAKFPLKLKRLSPLKKLKNFLN